MKTNQLDLFNGNFHEGNQEFIFGAISKLKLSSYRWDVFEKLFDPVRLSERKLLRAESNTYNIYINIQNVDGVFFLTKKYKILRGPRECSVINAGGSVAFELFKNRITELATITLGQCYIMELP